MMSSCTVVSYWERSVFRFDQNPTAISVSCFFVDFSLVPIVFTSFRPWSENPWRWIRIVHGSLRKENWTKFLVSVKRSIWKVFTGHFIEARKKCAYGNLFAWSSLTIELTYSTLRMDKLRPVLFAWRVLQHFLWFFLAHETFLAHD